MNLKSTLIAFILSIFVIGCGSQSRVVTTKKKQDKLRERTEKTVSDDKEKTGPEQEQPQVSTSTGKSYADIVKAYIDTYRGVAKEEMQKYGIPASITLAQGILESGAGTSELVVKTNNHFGIKCHKEWSGERVYHDDDRKGECFRKYKNPGLSYKDHSIFLTRRSHYKPLFSLPKDDYVSWAKGLKKAGYATDRNYPRKLIAIIERYRLYEYDAEVLEAAAAQEPPALPTPPGSGEKIYVVQEGDTLYSISKKYGLTVETLMQMNGLDTTGISIGQSLKIKVLK